MAEPETVLYGIRNCDTMKKARAWLTEHDVDYAFHDYRQEGVDQKKVETWVQKLGWDKVLNKASLTFRKLPDSKKQDLNAAKAVKLMVEDPTLIKRPMLDRKGELTAGFRPEIYGELFPVKRSKTGRRRQTTSEF